jgi:phosphohistidine phosphatase
MGKQNPEWGQIGDFDRKLTDSGKKQLKRLAQELSKRGVRLDQMVSSSAKRTLETAGIFSSILTCKKSDAIPELYEAVPKVIIEVIKRTAADIHSLLLVGHNPGISTLASYLSGEPYLIMKPGMMVKLEIYQEDWASIGQNTAVLVEIMQ